MSEVGAGNERTRDQRTESFRNAQQCLSQSLEQIGNENHYLGVTEKRNYDQMYDIAKKAESDLTTSITVAAADWLKKHLIQHNIFQIEQVYFDKLQQVTQSYQPQINKALWHEFYMIVDGKCYALRKRYLGEIRNRLEDLNAAIAKEFNDHKNLSRVQLLHIGQKEYSRVIQNMNDKEIQESVKIGYEKLMGIFSPQNDVIQGMLKQTITFYTSQLTNLPDEEFYSPVKLNMVHTNLERRLSREFGYALAIMRIQGQCLLGLDIHKKVEGLKELIQTEFISHVEAKQNILKRLQEQMSEILANANSPQAKQTDNIREKDEAASAEEIPKARPRKINESGDRSINKEGQSSGSPKLEQNPTKGSTNDRNVEHNQGQVNSDARACREELKFVADAQSKTLAHDEIVTETSSVSVQSLFLPLEQSSKKGTIPLPPLIFQLQSKRIIMGMKVNGITEILKNEEGDEFTPLVVGLTGEGDLACGKNVEKALSDDERERVKFNLKSRWWIFDCFANEENIWKETIELINGETHLILVEFLLGFILKQLKEHVESNIMNGICSTAIITVPYWFCSTQRVQVKTSAKLAGFANVYLINEESAAALACARSPSQIELEPPSNILVLSENSGKVGATIFSYSNRTKKLTMLGHCGSYSKEEQSSAHYNQEAILNIATEASEELAYLFGVCRERSSEQDEQIVLLRSICKGAIRNVSNVEKLSIWSEPFDLLCISENDSWRHAFDEVCSANVKASQNIMGGDYVPIFGATSFSEAPQTIPEIIVDKAGFSISVVGQKGTEREKKFKDITLPINTTTIKARFSELKTNVSIYETRASSVILGRLDIRLDTAPRSIDVDIFFQVSNEGIVQLLLKVADKWGSILRHKYTWESPDILPNDSARLQSLLEYLHQRQLLSNELLSFKKQLLLTKCDYMIRELEGGETFNIKSSVTKKLFTKRIDDAVNIANYPTATLEQIQEQLDGLIYLELEIQKISFS